MVESKSASVVFTNGSLLAKNAQAAAGSAKSAADNAYNLANNAQRTADGKNSIYRGSDPSTVPTAILKVGDLYFSENAAYIWNGSSWEEAVSDTTGKEIHAKVEEAMAEKDKAIAELDANIKAKVAEMDKEIEDNKIKTGNALNFYKEQYYLSNSYTELTGGDWSDEVPTKTAGKYIWSRYVTANVGDPTNQQYSDPVCISGLDGDTGPQGPQGPAGADVYYSKYEMSPNQQDMYLTDLTPSVSATNLPKIGSHVIAPSGKVYEVTATYPNRNPPQYGVGPQLTSIKGPKGDTGDQGIPGPKGIDGQTTYVHFAYANSLDGKTDFNVSYFNNALYVGTYTDYTPTDSGDYTKYTWSRLKGDTGQTGPKGDTGSTGFFIGTTPPPNPSKGTVWATNDSSGNMVSAKTWNGSAWVSTAFTQDLVAGNITASKIQGGELDINKITVKNAQNIPIDSTVSLGKKLSDIKQDADGLTLTVKNKGQNLLRDTDTVPIWGGDKETVDNFTVVKAVMNWDGDSYDPIAWNNLTTIKPNTDYTLSFWAKADQPADIYSYLNNIGTDTVYMDGSTLSHLTTSYQRFEIHFQTQNFSDGRTVNCLPMRVITKNVTHYIYGCQLEEGTMATAWSPDPEDISALKVTSGSLNAYVKGSRGSKTLESILSMDPDHSSIAQVVNGQIAAAIGTHSDGTVRIDGKALYINSHAKIDDATIKSAMIESIEAEKIKTGKLNADEVDIINLTADKIASGTLNGMTITGSKFIANTDNGNLFGTLWKNYQVVVDNTEVNIHGRDYSSNDWESILTSDSLYLQMANDNNTWIKSIDISIVGQNPHINLVNSGPNPGNYSSTYIGSDGVRAPIGQLGNWSMQGSKVLAQSGSLYVANPAGNNFDDNGSVGFQVWGGIGLGKSTIYMPANDLYIQQGNVGPALGQSYSSAGKVDVHCNSVISQRANTVSSRLSVKTDITPVSYDRALAAVEGTEMYDYRYVADDSGQHYVSGIIDDVNPDPQYHMDDMLINKERTARIDANLVGYHHVILQELLKKIDTLEIKLKSLESKEK